MANQSRAAKDIPLIAVTLGDVAGIGPEVVVRALAAAEVSRCCVPIVVGHPEIVRRAVELTGCGLNVGVIHERPNDAAELRSRIEKQSGMSCEQREALSPAQASTGTIFCWNPADDTVLDVAPGRVHSAAGDAAWRCLVAAASLDLEGIIDAIVTAPLNKESLHLAGHHFPGHTEILADQCGVPEYAMMLHLAESRIASLRSIVQTATERREASAGDTGGYGLSIAHVTLHTSIRSVPELLSTAGVLEKIRLMDEFLTKIGCSRRAIGVCALNPHGGENGLFGDEETRVILPAVKAAQNEHRNAFGPLPVDTLIRRAVAGEFDGVIAMYHDQGHIPVKLIGFDAAVNITLGLPIIRTSPTHGTAFDRAWNRRTPADAAGMIESIRMAATMCRNAAES